jgi:hypothetical protein
LAFAEKRHVFFLLRNLVSLTRRNFLMKKISGNENSLTATEIAFGHLCKLVFTYGISVPVSMIAQRVIITQMSRLRSKRDARNLTQAFYLEQVGLGIAFLPRVILAIGAQIIYQRFRKAAK